MTTAIKLGGGLLVVGGLLFGGLKFTETQVEKNIEAALLTTEHELGKITAVGQVKVDLLSHNISVRALHGTLLDGTFTLDQVTGLGVGISSVFGDAPYADLTDLMLENMTVNLDVKGSDDQTKKIEIQLPLQQLETMDLAYLPDLIAKHPDDFAAFTLEAIREFTARRYQSFDTVIKFDDVTTKIAEIHAENIRGNNAEITRVKNTEVSGADDPFKINIEEAKITSGNFVAGLATHNVMTIKNYTLDFSQTKDDEMAADLKTWGYEKVNININTETKWDVEKRLLDIKNVRFDVENAGQIQFDTSLANLPTLEQVTEFQAAQYGKNAEQALDTFVKQLVAELSVKDVSLKLSDAKLLEKIIAHKAGQLNATPAQVNTLYSTTAQQFMTPFLGADRSAFFAQNLKSFLDEGGDLTLELKTKGDKPLPVAQAAPLAVMMPQVLLQAIDVNLTHNK